MDERDDLEPAGDAADDGAAEQSPEEIQAEAEALLARLRAEHRRIDAEIDALIETGVADMLKVRRMKKIKLSMKDQIAYLENQLTPDIIA